MTRRIKELEEILWGKEDVPDLAALDGWFDDSEDDRATEMLSFRIDEATMKELKDIAERLGVGHTILARELLLAGLARLRSLDDD